MYSLAIIASPMKICLHKAAGEPGAIRDTIKGKECSAPPRTLNP